MIIADRNDFAHLALVTCLIASASVADNRLTDFLVDQLKLRQLIVSAQDTWFVPGARFVLLGLLATENYFTLNAVGDLLFLLYAYEDIFWVVSCAIPVVEIRLNFLDLPIIFV